MATHQTRAGKPRVEDGELEQLDEKMQQHRLAGGVSIDNGGLENSETGNGFRI